MTIERPLGRAISQSLRDSIESSATGEVLLCFATITHDDLVDPIRVVSEDDGGVSYNAGAIINYRWNGYLYLGVPFLWTIVSDTDQVPRASITIPNVQDILGTTLISLSTSPRLRLDLLKLSDFSAAIDAENARNEIGDVYPEFTADYLYLTDVKGDVMAVSGSITTYDLSSDPWPYVRMTQNRMPGIFIK